MSDEIEAFETHMDRMEREAAAQRADLEKSKLIADRDIRVAKLQARESTKETVVWIIGIIATVVAVLGLSFIIWQGTKGPSASQQLEDKWRSDCVSHNGTWVAPDSTSDTKGVCVAGGSTIVKP